MVMYFANPSTPSIVAAMQAGQLGCILTPAQRLPLPTGAAWCADNGCYGKGYPGDDAWWRWLLTLLAYRRTCAFAVAPDVVGDAEATLARSASWLPRIRGIGMPAALVAQDGLVPAAVPWDTFDVLFIGGTTAWKLGPAVKALAAAAQQHGKPVHLGRVNSRKRIQLAKHIGAASCDGTYLTFGPDTNLPRLLRWLGEADRQPTLEAI